MKFIKYILALIMMFSISGCGFTEQQQVTFITKTQAEEQGYYPTNDMIEYDYHYKYRDVVKQIQDKDNLKDLDFYQLGSMLIGFAGEEAKAIFNIIDTTLSNTKLSETSDGMVQIYFYIVEEEPQYGVYTKLAKDYNIKDSLYMIQGNQSTSDGKKFYELNTEEDNKINVHTIVFKEPYSFVTNYLPESQVISNVE